MKKLISVFIGASVLMSSLLSLPAGAILQISQDASDFIGLLEESGYSYIEKETLGEIYPCYCELTSIIEK